MNANGREKFEIILQFKNKKKRTQIHTHTRTRQDRAKVNTFLCAFDCLIVLAK